MSTEDQVAYVEGLRQMADFLESRPELIDAMSGMRAFVWHYGDSDLFARRVTLLGDHTSEIKGEVFVARRNFGPHGITIESPRDMVCEQVKVMREVTEWVYSDDAGTQ